MGSLGALDHLNELYRSQEGETIADIMITKLTGEVYELVDQIEAVPGRSRPGSVHCQSNDGGVSRSPCVFSRQTFDRTKRSVSFASGPH